jgi:hypothetical protein
MKTSEVETDETFIGGKASDFDASKRARRPTRCAALQMITETAYRDS